MRWQGGPWSDAYRATAPSCVDASSGCGLRQIELGLAWHYKAYEREQAAANRSAYAEAENAAKAARRGLLERCSADSALEVPARVAMIRLPRRTN